MKPSYFKAYYNAGNVYLKKGDDFIMRLLGTAVVENSSFRVAVIESGADGRQRTYREGDFANGMRIKQILRDRIVVLTSQVIRWQTTQSNTGR